MHALEVFLPEARFKPDQGIISSPFIDPALK